jgi:hypothetical protein
VVKAAWLAHVRNKEVEPAVIVVIAPGRSFGTTLVGDAGYVSHIHKRAVAAVVIQSATIARNPGLRRREIPRGKVFPTDEYVDQPVIVVGAPGGRLGGDGLSEASSESHVFESAVTLIAQERKAQRCLPSATLKRNIEVAVVVEIRPRDIEGVDLIAETRRR